jgi:MFS family permease
LFFPTILKEFGWTRASLAAAFSLYTLVYTGCGFLSGRLTDRWGPRRVVALGGLLAGPRSTGEMPGSWAVASCFPAIVGDFFGREYAGALTGMIFALGGPAVALGPVVAGWIYDRTGAYFVAFLLSALANAAALGILAFARAPAKRHAVD